ncbi:MAG TPA: cytochrome c3 family protein [Terriglobales bacterium]|nr:cytochrome c3 family protein [Terriglobales bacterium]
MPQIFHRSTNTIARVSIILALVLVSGGLWASLELQRSPYFSWRGVARQQPVPFSHQHHVSGLGIDCRYCHTSVENSNFAGIPPTKTCMNCHAQIWTNAPMLEPVRESFRSGKSLVWTRVNAVPDFVYFDHSIHVNKGVGCNECHGAVDKMPLMYAENTMQMEWCLSCHRAPEKVLRPKDQVFNMAYQKPAPGKPVTVNGKEFTDQIELGTYLKKEYKLRSVYDITSCNTCHR